MVPVALLGEKAVVFSKKVRKLEKRVENALKLLWYLGVEAWDTAVKTFFESTTTPRYWKWLLLIVLLILRPEKRENFVILAVFEPCRAHH